MTTSTPPTTQTFHLFPLLPYELRALIWQFTVLPREVDVFIPEPPCKRTTLSSTPVPGPLQACRESRHLLTRGVSTDSSSHPTNPGRFIGYEKAFQHSPSALTVSSPGYVYINFLLDTISITSTDLHCFTDPVVGWADMHQFKRIKRLKLEREYSATYHGEYFFHTEVKQISEFDGLEECALVCLDGILAFEDITYHNYFPCGKENVWLIDNGTGERMRAVELDRKCRREREEEARREGWWVSDDEEVGVEEEEDEDAASDGESHAESS